MTTFGCPTAAEGGVRDSEALILAVHLRRCTRQRDLRGRGGAGLADPWGQRVFPFWAGKRKPELVVFGVPCSFFCFLRVGKREL